MQVSLQEPPLDELYVLRDGLRYILYAPLQRRVAVVSRRVIELLVALRNNGKLPELNPADNEALATLRDLGVLAQPASRLLAPPFAEEFRPTNVTLLPTLDCNLRCVYCYASSGDEPARMDLAVAEAAVDFVIANAVSRHADEVQVGFLGGGEPFLAWDLVRHVVAHAKKRGEGVGVRIYVTGVTNGILSPGQVAWIAENFNYLNISLDGPASIHDAHRPMLHGRGSYGLVQRTVTTLRDRGFNFAVRSTISSLSVDSMPAVVDHFANELGIRRIHFEPLFACGRCRTTTELVPDPDRFLAGFKACLRLAQERNAELFCSLVRLDTLTSTFCGAMTENFYITPHGYVTACTEVSSPTESLARDFFVGAYEPAEARFVFWNDRRRRLASRTANNLTDCAKCISKWHCAGGCAVKAGHDRGVDERAPAASCQIARGLTEHYVRALATGDAANLPRIHSLPISPIETVERRIPNDGQ